MEADTIPTEIRSHEYDNGLCLLAERLPHTRAAAFAFLLPAGAVTEQPAALGASTLLSRMALRGAGERDTRQLSDALDDLGLQRGVSANTESTVFSGVLLGEDLHAALALHRDILRRPALPAGELDAERSLALQALAALEDNPMQKLHHEMTATYWSGPYGRSALGRADTLAAMTIEQLREDHERRYRPRGAILALAGRFDWDRLRSCVDELFGDWEGEPPPLPRADDSQRPDYRHIQQETAQEQIGAICPMVPPDSEHYYAARVSVALLSGGTSARLFTEVREKRGLCYAVGASYGSSRGAGGWLTCYAGTTPERSHETLEVMLAEVRRLADGVTEEELERARTGLLSALVMQGESSQSRAAALVRDQHLLGRVRTLDEIEAAVRAVTVDDILRYLSDYPWSDFTTVTLGPRSLKESA